MRALRLLPLMLLVAAAPAPMKPPIAPGMAPVHTALALDTEARWVPFTLTPGNQIRFRMMLDGTPVTAILDTGVSYSVMARDYAVAAGLPVLHSGDATAIGGVIPIGWVATKSMSLGGLTRSGGEIAVAPLPARATGGVAPVDLLIGADLLAPYALDIDYDAKRFRLLPSGRLPFDGASAPLMVSPRHRVFLTSIALGDHQLSPVIVDTGDGSMLTLSDTAWRTAEPTPPTVTTAIANGLGGEIETGLAIVSTVSVGQLETHQVEVRIEGADGFSNAVGAEGRIGSGLLERYRVLLDPTAGRMVLSPGATADTPPVRSTSGLLLALENDRLRVVHVMRGSPAAASGWRRGDLICRVDGQPIPEDYRQSPLAGWTVGAPGRVVTLGMCDGNERRLTLRRFY